MIRRKVARCKWFWEKIPAARRPGLHRLATHGSGHRGEDGCGRPGTSEDDVVREGLVFKVARDRPGVVRGKVDPPRPESSDAPAGQERGDFLAEGVRPLQIEVGAVDEDPGG